MELVWVSIMVLGKPGIGYGGRNSLLQRTAPCFCRSRADNIRVTGARPLFRSGPYYRTGHRKSVKIRKKSYGWAALHIYTTSSVAWALLCYWSTAAWSVLEFASPAVPCCVVGVVHWNSRPFMHPHPHLWLTPRPVPIIRDFGNNRCLLEYENYSSLNRTSNFAKVNKVNSSNRSPVHVLSWQSWLQVQVHL